MSVADTRVADGVQDRQVVFELVDLGLDILRNTAWAVLVAEGLGQLVHSAPHVADHCVNFLCVQSLERTCTTQPKVNNLVFNLCLISLMTLLRVSSLCSVSSIIPERTCNNTATC